MIVGGIDEAGRGPVFGPMVMSIAVLDVGTEAELKQLGVKDSKDLSSLQRDRFFDMIKERAVEYAILEVPASELNELMNKHSLNEIEAMKIAFMINKLKCTPDVIYVDSPDAIALNFTARIEKYLEKKVKIVSENKADSTYTVVGAASVLAKVSRDRRVKEICTELNCDFGSGYPSDPKTKKWLAEYVEKHSKLPPYTRVHWSTSKRALDKVSQKTLF